MRMTLSKEREYYTVPELQKIPFLIHGFGTRFWTESQIRNQPGWEHFSFVFLRQKHSTTIHRIDTPPFKSLSGDAMITDRPNILLAVKTADCLPVLIVSEAPKAVAAVHCGWRGTCEGLVQKAAQEMKRAFGCRPSSLTAALGPSITQDCYEVGEDVRECFEDRESAARYFRPGSRPGSQYLFDLRGANRSQLLASGLREENIHAVDLNTYSEPTLFSYRRDSKETGRMINFIGMSFSFSF